jgi:hypothetical protein
MQKRIIIIMLLGLITAVALFGFASIGLYMTLSSPSIGNTIGFLYIAIPVVLLLLVIAMNKFKRTINRRLLIYAISVLVSAFVVVPVLYLICLIVVVWVFGMPVPS